MDAELWTRVQELFHRAVELRGRDREEFLKRCRRDDPEAGQIVTRMAEEDGRNSAVWERELASVVGQSSLRETLPLPTEDAGTYEFLSPLGQGGMGTVYLGRHRGTGQLVAIKVLRSGELSAASRERFLTEQRALARLNHPLIARLYASESFRDGTPYFVMEYVEGEALVAWCRKRGSSARERMLLFRQVCEAVQHAHQHAIIHRDLKPSNVLVKPDGTVRLLDFGIAKQLDAGDAKLTEQQPAPVTLAYAAPEQLTGGSVGTHTDVYALGVTLYEMLTEQPALNLTGLTPGGVESAIRERSPEPPSRLMKEFGSGLDREDLDLICATAIHKESERRYRTVEALIRDLDHWLRSEPLEARRDSLAYRVNRFRQRNRKPLAAAGLMVLLVASGTVWFTARLASARDAAVREQTRTKRIEEFMLSLFDNGDPTAGPARSATALTMLDRGKKAAQTLGNEPGFQTDVYETLGNLYYKVGRFDEASSLLEAAAERRTRDKAATTKERADSLIALGTLRADQSKFAQGEKLIQQGLALLRADGNSGKQAIASAESALGLALTAARDFKGAIPVLEDALRIQTGPGGAESELAKTLNALAGAQQEAGNLSEADRLLKRALDIDRRVYGDAHPQVANDLLDLGHLRQDQRRFPEAVIEYKKAIEIFDAWYGRDHPSTIQALVTMGEALLYSGQYEPSRKALAEGVSLARQVMGPKDQVLALGLSALGTLEQKTGNLQGAEGYFEQVLESSRALWGDGSFEVAVAESNLAVLELAVGRLPRAETLLRNSLRIVKVQFQPTNQNIGTIEQNLGKVLVREKKYGEAQELLHSAISILGKEPIERPGDLAKAEAALAELKRLRGF